MTVFADAAPFVAAAPPRRSRSTAAGSCASSSGCCASTARVRRAAGRGSSPCRGARRERKRPDARGLGRRHPRSARAAKLPSRRRARSIEPTARSERPARRGERRSLLSSVLATIALIAAGPDPRPAGSSGNGKRCRQPRPAGVGLAHALRLLRESARRPAADRRRAADYVARAVPRDRGDAAAEASRIAWSAPDPQPPEVVALADRVEGASDT